MLPVSRASCLKLLHDVGIILHFKEPKLANLVIVDPSYLVNIMVRRPSFLSFIHSMWQ
jgi:hypothetical protein